MAETVEREQATPTSPHTGASVAAFFAAGLGLLILALVQVGTVLNEAFRNLVFDIGKTWIPHAEHIGPYSGKETLWLAGWVASWILLHFSLRGRTVDVRRWFAAFLVVLLAATLLLWPPVWHVLEGG